MLINAIYMYKSGLFKIIHIINSTNKQLPEVLMFLMAQHLLKLLLNFGTTYQLTSDPANQSTLLRKG